MSNLNRYTYYIQMVVDLISLVIAFFISYGIKTILKNVKPDSYGELYFGMYMQLLAMMLIAYIVVTFVFYTGWVSLNKTFTQELRNIIKVCTLILMIFLVFTFFTKSGFRYSRDLIAINYFMSVLWMSILRLLLKKKIFPVIKKGNSSEKIVLIGTYKEVCDGIKRLTGTHDWRYWIQGAIVTDRDLKGDSIDNVDIISNQSSMFEDISEYTSMDSVYLFVNQMNEKDANTYIHQFADLGKVVHLNIHEYDILRGVNRYIDQIGDNAVISHYPVVRVSVRQVTIKRFADITISILLLPLLFVVSMFTFIFEGIGRHYQPITLNRVRVGKNGRRFYQHRYRVLRSDAFDRKTNGKSGFTAWGRFLKITHLNGLPSILNVLSGDMSFVGPHAPTIQRYIEYSTDRRKNLCIKPGIVGSWAIEEEEQDIIADERSYIEKWSIIKDLKIVFNAIAKFISFHSDRDYTQLNYDEEAMMIKLYRDSKAPLEYDRDLYHAKRSLGEWVYLFLKRLFDIIVSLIGLIFSAPIQLILMVLVVADDGGSPFYGHSRVGKNGKKIKVYKFRSMKQDAGDLEKLLTPEQLEQYKREFKIDNDPRITKIGNVLRKTSLDELPQIFNILKGDISLIGPRPIVEKETVIYGNDIGKLLSVKPGLTGYWQAYARNNATYESGERQKMEMYYVEHHSLWLDIKIFFKTITSVLKREGAQ